MILRRVTPLGVLVRQSRCLSLIRCLHQKTNVHQKTSTNVRSDVDVDERMSQKYSKRVDMDIAKTLKRDAMNKAFMEESIELEDILDGFTEKTTNVLKEEENLISHLEWTYFSPMEATLNGIIAQIITRVITELNLRKTLLNDIPDSLFFTRNVAHIIGKDQAILENLVALYYNKKREHLPQDLDQFFNMLDKPGLHKLIDDDFGSKTNFSSLSDLRLSYCYNKSGQYLNYEDSELTRFVKGYRPKFTTCIPDDCEETIDRIRNHFLETKPYNDQKLRLELMLKVAHELIQLKAPPSLTFFSNLLTVLNQSHNNFLNYEGIIWNHLVDYEFKTSLLSGEDFNPNLIPFYYKSAIENEPMLLHNLANFLSKVKHSQKFIKLLSLLKFDEVVQLEEAFKKSDFNQLISKSRFIKNRNEALANILTVQYSKPIFLGIEPFYNLIEKCLELELPNYIDLIINKIIFNSVEGNDGQLSVVFSVNETFNLDQFKFIIDHHKDLNTIITTIFNKKLILLIIKVIDKTDDLGRLMWLLPNLDIVINAHKESFRNHTQEINNLLNKHNNKTITNNDIVDFITKDSNIANGLNLQLMYRVYKKLHHYGIDGKLVSYERDLEIPKTILNLNQHQKLKTYLDM